MNPEWQRYKCYVCNEKYDAMDLGRLRLPLYWKKGLESYFRVVCVVCYQALYDAWVAADLGPPPALHGF